MITKTIEKYGGIYIKNYDNGDIEIKEHTTVPLYNPYEGILLKFWNDT